MLRHRLAALFEPRSLLVLSSRELPVVRTPPALLEGRIAVVRIGGDGRWQMPRRLDFLEDGQRLDMALLCLDPASLPAALDALAVPVIVTSSHQGELVQQQKLPWPCAWALGHEGQGVGDEVASRARLAVRIGQPGGEESLNVAAAAAICLHASAISRPDVP